MPRVQTTPRRIVIVGPSGRELAAEAHIPVPDDGGPAAWVPIAIAVVILAISLFVPPILMLNLPILFFRSALNQARRARFETVALPLFDCPECGGPNPPSEQSGEIPLDVVCIACGQALSVRPAPRKNLAAPDPAPDRAG